MCSFAARITAVGAVPDPGSEELDATGLVVTHGFVDVHPHWLFFAEPALTVVGIAILTIVLAATVGDATLNIVMLTLLVVALLWAGWRTLTWRTTHFVITTDRLIYRSGVFASALGEVPQHERGVVQPEPLQWFGHVSA